MTIALSQSYSFVARCKMRYIQSCLYCILRPVAKTKTATLNLRIDPDLKRAVRALAEREHRSVANMVEMLIRRHSKAAGVPLPERHTLPEINPEINDG